MSVERGVYFAPSDCLGVGRRLIIDIVDFIATTVAGVILSAVLRNPVLLLVIWPGVLVTYFVFLKGTYRTLGYVVAGARIVGYDGERPSYGMLSFRLAFVMLGTLYTSTNYIVDILWLSSDPARQALRDRITRTYVVRRLAQPAGSGAIAHEMVTLHGGALLLTRVSQTDLPA